MARPEQLPEGVEWNEGRVKEFAKLAHEAALTPKQVAMLQEWDLAQQTGHAKVTAGRMVEIEREALGKQQEILAKEWGSGPEYEKNRSLAARTALTAGFTMEEIGSSPIFRNAAVVKAFAKLGAMMSEDSLARGSEGGGFASGRAQGMDIISNPQNPYYKRYHDGDESVRGMVQGFLRK